LRSKHPDARIPKPESLPTYAHTPDFVKVDITADAIVAWRLSGSAGLVGGTGSHALKHWLLRFGVTSVKLCEALVDFTDWLSKSFPPWGEYQALMSGRLCAKILLLVGGAEVKEACGIDQLCAGLEAGAGLEASIEGSIHVMQAPLGFARDRGRLGILAH
jgi:hypothetical protein